MLAVCMSLVWQWCRLLLVSDSVNIVNVASHMKISTATTLLSPFHIDLDKIYTVIRGSLWSLSANHQPQQLKVFYCMSCCICIVLSLPRRPNTCNKQEHWLFRQFFSARISVLDCENSVILPLVTRLYMHFKPNVWLWAARLWLRRSFTQSAWVSKLFQTWAQLCPRVFFMAIYMFWCTCASMYILSSQLSEFFQSCRL